MMFLFTHVHRSITRNRGRSLLSVVLSFLLFCLSGIYLGSIWSNENLLRTLGERIPVSASVTNADGSRDTGLAISTHYAQGLLDLDIKDPILTAESYGNIEKAKNDRGSGAISLYLMGVNDIGALTVSPENLQLAGSSDFLAGDSPKCILNREYVERNELAVEVGSALDMNLFRALYDSYGSTFTFAPVAPARIEVAGFYENKFSMSGTGEAPDVICPVNWLRAQYEAANTPFVYNSAACTLRDPLRLNAFKARAKTVPFQPVEPQGKFSRSGTSLYVNDRLFIETATQVTRNIRMLRLFIVPVVLLLLMILTLASFYLTRSRMPEISIAQGMGISRASIRAALVLENGLLALFGGLLAALLIFMRGENTRDAWLPMLLLFMGCQLAGSTISALMLTRESPMRTLSRVD